jgi:hypothetical protein
MTSSMPRRVCSRPSCVAMKHACTYQPITPEAGEAAIGLLL